jgi:hypothetical protein
MRYSPKDLMLGVLKTSLLLIVLEIFSTAFLPAIGLNNIKLAFSVLIVLFMAFKLETPFLAILILVIQYVHSIFSIEGWAIGTLVGIIISLSVKYLRDLLQFSTAVSTIIVVQIFQIAWFAMVAFLLSIKLGDFSSFFSIFWQFVPESILLSLLSPFFFTLLDRFWRVKDNGSGVAI